MIAELLPDGIAAVEIVGDDFSARLLPEEEIALGQVAEGRRRQFTSARSCAHRALAQLGLPPTPVLSGPNREPLWPTGIVGSITHCPGYSAAAVARREQFVSVGIDAEPDDELPAGILERIALPEEQNWIRIQAGANIHWDRVLFSVKESVYKTWFPITGRWLGFEDALVEIDVDRQTFHAHLLHSSAITDGRTIAGFDGRFCISAGFVLTCVTVPAL